VIAVKQFKKIKVMTERKRFSDTLTDEQYNKLTRLDYDRKPAYPEEISSSINFNELHESIRGIVASLPIVEFPGSFFDYFLDGDQQFYLVTDKDKVFLVDTQGYDYARYVIHLKDLVVLEKEETMQMKAHPGMVEEIIGMLKHMEVDGETMEHIIRSVGMEEQMLRQLIMTHTPYHQIEDLISERRQLDLPSSWTFGALNKEEVDA
jgi:hypothetical protein